MKKLYTIIVAMILFVLPAAVLAETFDQPAVIMEETLAINTEAVKETIGQPTVVEFFSEVPEPLEEPPETKEGPADLLCEMPEAPNTTSILTPTPTVTPSETPSETPEEAEETPTASPEETEEPPTPSPTATPEPTETPTTEPEDTEEPEIIEETEGEESENVATATDLQKGKKKKKTLLTEEDFVLTYGSVTISLGDTPDGIIEEMANGENPPCTIQEDRITILTYDSKSYENEDIAVMTVLNEAGNAEVINAVFVETPGIKTSRGVEIGDSVKKMRKLYGEPALKQGDTVLYYVETPTGYQSIVFQIEDRDDTVFSYALLDMYPKNYKLPNK